LTLNPKKLNIFEHVQGKEINGFDCSNDEHKNEETKPIPQTRYPINRRNKVIRALKNHVAQVFKFKNMIWAGSPPGSEDSINDRSDQEEGKMNEASSPPGSS
jgi:hypothetical protein